MEQEVLNKMSETLIRSMNQVLEYHDIGISSIELKMPDGTTTEINFDEALRICLAALDEKLTEQGE